ncbi:MAG: uracil-DNA glycosylase family protein [Planctomycetota bacterium]
MPQTLRVISDARRCTICAEHLPLEPRPLLAGSAGSRILLIGQAPGRATHDRGEPWRDASGDRLRDWLGLDEHQFYNPALVAQMPMGFCYPGKGASGDLPPRPECAPKWHPRLLRAFRAVELTVLIGRYAFDRYLRDDLGSRATGVTEIVHRHQEWLPDRIALPHPSPRNNIWLKKNRWFERRCVPALRERVAELVGSRASDAR